MTYIVGTAHSFGRRSPHGVLLLFFLVNRLLAVSIRMMTESREDEQEVVGKGGKKVSISAFYRDYKSKMAHISTWRICHLTSYNCVLLSLTPYTPAHHE